MIDEYETSGYDPNSEFVDNMSRESDEEMGIDYHAELSQDIPDEQENNRKVDNRAAKIKPMPPSYQRVFPNVSSILITRFDGRQVLFVRR